jgi:hypothetical protein
MNDLNATVIMGAGGTTTTVILNQYVNPALATVTALLTILILSQKLYANWKKGSE